MTSRNISILAVDDIMDNLITLNALIKEVYPNATVAITQSGEEAYKLAMEKNPDVIILDIVMPGMDGFELCTKLKSHRILRDIPVIFLTALKGDKQSRIKALDCGAEAFLSKPVDTVELTAQINAMIKIRQSNIQKQNEKERLAQLVKEQTYELEKSHNKTIELLEALKQENEERKKSEQALLEAQKLSHIGSFCHYTLSDKTVSTDEALNIVGLNLYESLNRNDLYELIHRSDIEYVTTCNKKAISKKCSADYNCRIVRPDGKTRVVNIRFTPEFKNDIHVKSTGTIQDITERIKSENELRETKDYLEKLIGFANAPIVVWNNDGLITSFNKGFERISGRNESQVIGKSYNILFPKNEAQRVTNLIKQAQENDGLVNEQVDILHIDGSIRTFLWNSATIYDKYKNPISYIAQGQDITDRVKAEKELLYLSYHDQLTGLYNRRFFEEEIQRLNVKRNLPLTIVMGDVNGLKIINDSLGHPNGDTLLKKAANAITKACREDDIIARIGGDEFVILLPKTCPRQAVQIIERIKSQLVDTNNSSVDISISFGYSTKMSIDDSILDIMAKAENEMYRHKLSEKSSVRSQTIDMIMNTLFEKSNRESMHSVRVSKICELIAQKMNFEKDDIDQIRLAGLLHDIGKIGVNEKILNKNEKLNDLEWIEMKKHPESGWRILSAVKEFSEVANYVLAHHEKWDGTGYPNGHKGKDIPIQARIITVADAYDAMTSMRAYQRELDKEAAIIELKKYSGIQFDPKIVEIFTEKCANSDLLNSPNTK